LSASFNLEFYIQKKPIDRNILESVFLALKRNNMKYGHFIARRLDRLHHPLQLDPSLPESEAIEAIIKKEDGIFFSIGHESGSFGMGIYSNGYPGSILQSKKLKESNEGTISYGRVRLEWEMLEQEHDLQSFTVTMKIAPDLYNALRPIYGFSYFELFGSEYYNLIPTETNIFLNGPKDLFDINLWNPGIVTKIDLSRLKKETSLSIMELKDGGVFIHISPETFMSGDRKELIKAEQILGWYRKDRRETRIF